ncbi:tetratricopeptide repeat protein, partial [Candidatus Sumerlaeota bacterium]|nr:tetratricopeptide repeat protein [Candidatus Sumerlaeota bacterium]
MAKTPSPEEIEKNYREFQKLFMAARAIHRKTRNRDEAEKSPEHQAALKFAHEQNWNWGETLLRASILEWTNDAEAALDLMQTLHPEEWPCGAGLYYFVCGGVEGKLKHWDESIQANKAALNDPAFDYSCYTWSNMGLAYREKGEYDQAIECYQKALDTPGFDSPGDAWYNMGSTYGEKGEQDRAIECFQKALDTPGY